MLVSESKKFLFIHIPRTGGTSLRQALLANINDATPVGFQHSGVQTEGEKLFEKYHDYFVFTVVRNPWDRVYSWYKLLKRYSPKPSEFWSFRDFLFGYEHHYAGRQPVDLFYVNQLDYISTNAERVLPRMILRYETYCEDVSDLFMKIGLVGMQCPHLNTSEGDHSRQSYTEDLVEKVGRMARRDIEYFGYSFNNEILFKE